MTTTEQLVALLESPDVPDHIKRHFAADCTERALMVAWEATGNEPDPRSVRAVEVVRLYVEGRATVEELNAAQAEASKSQQPRIWAVQFWACSASAWAATLAPIDTALDAARSAAAKDRSLSMRAMYGDRGAEAERSALFDAERGWQLAHLLGLIEQYKQQRASLLSALLKRSKRISSDLPKMKGQLEEVLFT